MAHGLHKCRACGGYRTSSSETFVHCTECGRTEKLTADHRPPASEKVVREGQGQAITVGAPTKRHVDLVAALKSRLKQAAGQ